MKIEENFEKSKKISVKNCEKKIYGKFLCEKIFAKLTKWIMK